MALIEIQLNKHRNKTEAKWGENAFFEWCDRNGLGLEGYSLVVTSDKQYKGKRVRFYVESYGSFETLEGWRLYISYRGDIVNHVLYHSYQWDGKQAVISSHKLNEFINI